MIESSLLMPRMALSLSLGVFPLKDYIWLLLSPAVWICPRRSESLCRKFLAAYYLLWACAELEAPFDMRVAETLISCQKNKYLPSAARQHG